MCNRCLTNANEAVAGFILVMKTNIYALVIVMLGCQLTIVHAQSKHSPMSHYENYDGLVMCGYQGWFRAPDDGAQEGWGHYAASRNFDADHVHVDLWPDVSEYSKTYPTSLTNN